LNTILIYFRRSFTQGMAAPLYGVTPMYSLCFFGYGIGQKLLTDDQTYRSPPSPWKSLQIGAAGAVSAIFTTPILAPTERAKCLLQTQHLNKSGQQFKGPGDVMRHLYKTGGLKSLNRGFFATMGRYYFVVVVVSSSVRSLFLFI
jgi:solute carrier family 25 carnitine/acylcarnitine transporter 20/29